MKFEILFVVLASFIASAVSAQTQSSGLVVGDQVRFALVTSSNSSDSIPCEGRVARLVFDTAVVSPFGKCGMNVPSPDIIHLQLEKRRGSRTDHLLKGLIFGAIGGGLIGRLIAGDGCKPGGCDDGYYAIIEFTGAGIVSGAIVGSSIGFALPVGIHWRAVSVRSVRLDYGL